MTAVNNTTFIHIQLILIFLICLYEFFYFTMNISTERTLGDGVDNTVLELTETASTSKPKFQVKISDKTRITFTPIEPKCQVFNLKPVYVIKQRKQPKCLIRKPKEPKFVPYEPYKAAVEPIKPHRNDAKPILAKRSRNNVEIQDLVAQMSEMRVVEMRKLAQESEEEELILRSQWEKERAAYETDIKNLHQSNSHLENQIKFQTQVNSELKTLLVAAVGEDLESRVQHLTEDKLQLARALLNSANHLTSHREQTEWLSGQCEVWRSKFLASSVMVEELARWKSALATRINDLHEIIKKLLDERRKMQEKGIKTCAFLQAAQRKLGSHDVKSVTSEELEALNLSLSREICNLLCVEGEISESWCHLQHTPGERAALKAIQNPVSVTSQPDAICKALMGTAVSLSGEQVYLRNPIINHATCPHCTGDIKNI